MNHLKEKIIGKWEATEQSIGGKMKFEFNDIGKGTVLLPIQSDQFDSINWMINKNKLTIIDSDGFEIGFKLKYIDDDILKMKMIKLGGARQLFEKTRTFRKYG